MAAPLSLPTGAAAQLSSEMRRDNRASSSSPQRSSSLSYKGQQHAGVEHRQRSSPLVGQQQSTRGREHDGDGDDDDDEIPLHPRPASFAGPVGASRLNAGMHLQQQQPSLSSMLAGTSLAGIDTAYTDASASALRQTRSRDSTAASPRASTSKLPYEQQHHHHHHHHPQHPQSHPHTANPTTSSQYRHYAPDSGQQQQQQQQASSRREWQDSGPTSRQYPQQQQQQQHQHQPQYYDRQQQQYMPRPSGQTPPRRSRSFENTSDPSIIARGGGSAAGPSGSGGATRHHLGPPQGQGPGANVTSGSMTPGQSSSSSNSRRTVQMCAKCGKAMTGQFVRALGAVFHLDCFRCQDCNKIVAAKFFPVDGPEGKQYPLCETDYFRRLSLICAKCGMALRGSYITALDMKFHVEHFTCSVCPTVFGPQDSYYEHGGQVYCHFHYSTRFAVKCTGCKTAILKQFVEINRNNVDEHWHPECYMIHKFWNIKLVPSSKKQIASSPATGQLPDQDSGPTTDQGVESTSGLPGSNTTAGLAISVGLSKSTSSGSSLDWETQEKLETAHSLREKQKHVEAQVYRIWTVLSTFEESSAACISEMLRHVSNGHYLDGVKMAEKFVLHVETLFAAIDDLNAAFRHLGSKEIPHVREARMLCKKVVNFFSLLSHTHESGARKLGITQDLLSLVTGLAHYLKLLIRIALTAALKLERDYSSKTSLSHFLSRLDRLCRDPEIAKAAGSPVATNHAVAQSNGADANSPPQRIEAGTGGLKSRPCGYKSLARPGGSFINQVEGETITDLCEMCHLTVEEECVRFGTNLRWHLSCLQCSTCQRCASKEKDPTKLAALALKQQQDAHSTGAPERKAPLYLKEFRIELYDQRMEDAGASSRSRPPAGRIFCSECPSSSVQDGFEYVTRLEQYAFLLCVALNKLYYLLKRRGVLASSLGSALSSGKSDDERSIHEAYRDSQDIKRMKSVNLDRKTSTTAKVAQRLTIVEGPAGRTATAQAGVEGSAPSPRADEPVASIRHVQPQQPQETSPHLGSQSPALVPSTSPLVPQREIVPSEAKEHYVRQQAAYHNNQQAFQQQQQQQHNAALPSSDPAARPGYNRSTTAIRVVEEQPPIEHGAFRDVDHLGSERSPIQDEDGITLADLHQVMEAEQAREQGGSGPRHAQMLLSELSALEYFIVRHAAVITLASDVPPYRDFDVAQLDELLDIIDAKKNNFWGKLFKGGNKDKKEVKKKGVFGVPLEVLVERHGTDSMLGAGPGSLRVPTFIDDAVTAMKQMDLSVEGIFRKNGNIRRLKDLADAIDRDPDSVNLADDNPVQMAALLKKFLRDLPDPLLTFRLQHLYLATQHIENDEDRLKILHLITCLMPKHHRDTMEVLFVFLKWVASFSHVDEETGSKMDLQNLATVICPNILYSRGKDPSKDESFLGIRAVAEMLMHQDELFTVPSELTGILGDSDLFANPAELSSKDILKKAEVHLRERQRIRERGPFVEPSQAAFRSGSRGEVKHTHPHYHAPFSPNAPGQRTGLATAHYDSHPSAAGIPIPSPRPGNADRPLSWQAVPYSATQSGYPHQQQHLAHQEQSQHQYQFQTFAATGPQPDHQHPTIGTAKPQYGNTLQAGSNGMLSPSLEGGGKLNAPMVPLQQTVSNPGAFRPSPQW